MFELPVMISERAGGFRIAVMISDDVVVSRGLSRADLEQLRVRINAALGETGSIFDDDWESPDR